MMNQYQLERIFRYMERDFGKMSVDEARNNATMMMPIEMNAMRAHRQHPSTTGRHMNEALALVLHDLRGHMTGKPVEGLEEWRSEENGCLEHAVLMSFDPFTNSEVRLCLEEEHPDWEKPEVLRRYYGKIIPGLLRIQDSVAFWTREEGSQGYFRYMESVMGYAVKGEKMQFSVPMIF